MYRYAFPPPLLASICLPTCRTSLPGHPSMHLSTSTILYCMYVPVHVSKHQYNCERVVGPGHDKDEHRSPDKDRLIALVERLTTGPMSFWFTRNVQVANMRLHLDPAVEPRQGCLHPVHVRLVELHPGCRQEIRVHYRLNMRISSSRFSGTLFRRPYCPTMKDPMLQGLMHV